MAISINTYSFTLDTKTKSVPTLIRGCFKGDNNTTELTITLTKNGGSTMDLTGLTVVLGFKRPDGVTVLGINPTITTPATGVIKYTMQSSEMAVSGKCIAEIKISDSNGKRISTYTFNYFVEEGVDIDNGVIASESDKLFLLTDGERAKINNIPSDTNGELGLKVDKVTGKALVTNGDTHNHSGGDGADIDHANLLDKGTNTHSQIDNHISNTDNPHSVTKNQVGLGNADNTSDLNKPISTATQQALDLKVDKVTGKQLSTEDYTTAEKNKLAGISGTNTGDETQASIKSKLGSASTSTDGYLTSTDWNTFNSKLDLNDLKTTQDLTYYVDFITGNDTTGDGTALTPYKTVNKIIGILPITINHVITINIAGNTNTGSTTTDKININRLFKTENTTGLIYLKGMLESTTGENNNVYYINCVEGVSVQIYCSYLKFVQQSTINIAIQGRIVIFNYCTIAGGILVYNGFCSIQNSVFSGSSGVRSYRNAYVNTINCSGNVTNYGLNAYQFGRILKSGTQPTGTAGNEYTETGGQIV